MPTPLDYSSTRPVRIRGRSRKIIVALLLLVGVQTWLIFAGRGGAYWGRNAQLCMLLIIAAIAILPFVHRPVFRALRSIRRPTRGLLALMALVVAIASGLYLYFDAIYQDRSFQPKYHDEFSYIIQTRMVADFRLFTPGHPLADHFETFQFITRPGYASVYFPGAAVMYAPGIWLNFKPWAMPLVVSSLCVAMVFLIVARLIDAPAGFIAALMMLANPIFRLQSLMVLAQAPAMLLMLIALWAWLNWRTGKSLRWAALIGFAIGWCAVTRPLDALCAAIVIGGAMILNHGRLIRSLLIIIAAASPFLLLQLGFNKLVAGYWFKTPFAMNIEQTFPQTQLGFRRFDPTIRPASRLPQKQAHYDKIAVEAIKSHTWREVFTNWGDNRLRLAVVANVPTWLMLVLVPAGLLGIVEDRRKLVVWLTLPVFVALYIFYPFYLAHYVVFAAPAVILNLLSGADVIARAWPRRRNILSTFFTISLAALSISEFAEFNRIVHDEWFDAPQLMRINQVIADLPRKPAIVLFKWSQKPDGEWPNSEEEPVYNWDVTWPDRAEVIRAHDLGEARNVRLYQYYARRPPDRAVYRYDRGNDSLTYLGTVRELAAKYGVLDTTPPAPPAIISVPE